MHAFVFAIAIAIAMAATTASAAKVAPAVKAADTTDAMAHGREVFSTYCVLCHGERADGRGRAADILGNVRPANLLASVLDDSATESIIRSGGASVGRSQSMPAWAEQLSDQQIKDLLVYVRAVRTTQGALSDR